MTPSRLLESLLTEARTTTDRVAWAKAVCRAAAHQARSGRTQDALASLAQVRKVFGPGLHPNVASWLMLSEGILHHCGYDWKSAYDRIMRALLLANGFNNINAIASCAAWMANMEYHLWRLDDMAKNLTLTFNIAEDFDHSARCRASLILGSAYMFAGDFANAQRWNEQARRHAVAIGDEASLGAMLFNVAVGRIAKLRLDVVFGIASEQELKRCSLEVSGSASFDQLTSNPVQAAWRNQMLGRQYLLENQYELALQHFNKAFSIASDLDPEHPSNLIDLIWAEFNIGVVDSLDIRLENIMSKSSIATDEDDMAYIHATISKIEEKLGRTQLSRHHAELAKDALNRHKEVQGKLHALLTKIPAVPKM